MMKRVLIKLNQDYISFSDVCILQKANLKMQKRNLQPAYSILQELMGQKQ